MESFSKTYYKILKSVDKTWIRFIIGKRKKGDKDERKVKKCVHDGICESGNLDNYYCCNFYQYHELDCKKKSRCEQINEHKKVCALRKLFLL